MRKNIASAKRHDSVARGGCMMRGQRTGQRERPWRQATQPNHQPNKRGARRGGGIEKVGGETKAPDNVMQRNATTNKWGGVKSGGCAG